MTTPHTPQPPYALLAELRDVVDRVQTAFARGDGNGLVALSDEFMGYADDLAEHGHLLGAPRPSQPGPYLCAVCHRESVAAEAGYDTCDSCLRRV